MTDALRLPLTRLRCLIGFSLFLAASSLLRIALKFIPRGHPGRTYAEGRWHTGRTRLGEALGVQATARYIASRR